MIDISSKIKTQREAVAEGILVCSEKSEEAIRTGVTVKGNIYEVARTAGILAAKRVSDNIPLCHNIPLDHINIRFEKGKEVIKVFAKVKSKASTGVEMEALFAASIVLLTLYDMLKPIDDNIQISQVKLLKKSGGKKDFSDSFDKPIRTSLLVMSDSVYKGKKQDKAGMAIKEKLEKNKNIEIVSYEILPDEKGIIKEKILELCHKQIDLVLASGGTGLSPRDVTVEAVKEIIDREVPGISEAQRLYGFERTPYSMLSRSVSGLKDKTLIVTLPGSTRGAEESVDALFPWILHVFKVLEKGYRHANS